MICEAADTSSTMSDEWSTGVSRVCAITVNPETGIRAGGADPRSTSYAIGW